MYGYCSLETMAGYLKLIELKILDPDQMWPLKTLADMDQCQKGIVIKKKRCIVVLHVHVVATRQCLNYHYPQ